MNRPIVQLIKMNKSQFNESKPLSFNHHNEGMETQTTQNLAGGELKQMNVTDPVIGSIFERLWTEKDLDRYKTSPLRSSQPETGFPKPSRRIFHTKSPVKPTDSTGRHFNIPLEDQTTLNQIAEMSEDERRSAVKELECVLGNDLIESWRKRALRKAHQNLHDFSGSDIKAAVSDLRDSVGEPEKKLVIDITSACEAPLLRIDQQEANKLLWTCPAGSLETDRVISDPDQNPIASIRFHLNGIPVDVQLSKELSEEIELFHHGHQPELPGYTLKELAYFWLQSVNSKQRLISLQTLLCIVKRSHEITVSRLPVKYSCQHHSSLCSASSGQHESLLSSSMAGFGYGLAPWNRFIFETLELHYKTFLCLRCGSAAVRLAAVQLLSELLTPSSILPITLVNVLFKSLQRPSLLIYSLHQFIAAFRRVLLNDQTEQLFQLLCNSQQPYSLDESIQRLSFEMEKEKNLDNMTQLRVSGLSAFDSIVQILLSSSSDMHNVSFSFGGSLAVMLKETFSNVFGELSIVRFLISLTLHSKQVVKFVIFSNDKLVESLRHLVLSLTHGTLEATQRAKLCSLSSTDHAYCDLLCHVGFFIELLCEFKEAKNGSYLIKIFPDLSVLVVFIRQLLMKDLKTLTGHPCCAQALSILTIWEIQGIWEEDFECFFPDFLRWICETKAVYMKNLINPSYQKSLPTCSSKLKNAADPEGSQEFFDYAGFTRLACLGRYVWTVLLHRTLTEKLLATAVALVHEMMNTLLICEDQLVATQKNIFFLQFRLELIKLLTVLSSQLVCFLKEHSEKHESFKCFRLEIHKFLQDSQRLQCSSQCYLVFDVKEKDSIVEQSLLWLKESGCLGDYTQYVNFDIFSLQLFLSFRITICLCEFEYLFHQLIDIFIQRYNMSGSIPVMIYYIMIPTADLLSYASWVKDCIMEFSQKCFCLGVCQRQHAFCGAPDILRNMNPITNLFYDALQGLERLLHARHQSHTATTSPVLDWMTVSTTSQVAHLFLTKENPPLAFDVVQFIQSLLTGMSKIQLDVNMETPLSTNLFYCFFRIFGVLIRLYYQENPPSNIKILDQSITRLVFKKSHGNTFATLLRSCFASTLIEQLLFAYSSLIENVFTWPSEPMLLEECLQDAWLSVATQFYQEAALNNATAEYFDARFEKVLPPFILTFKKVPELPQLTLKLLETLCNPQSYDVSFRIIRSDSSLLQLLLRRNIRFA